MCPGLCLETVVKAVMCSLNFKSLLTYLSFFAMEGLINKGNYYFAKVIANFVKVALSRIVTFYVIVWIAV